MWTDIFCEEDSAAFCYSTSDQLTQGYLDLEFANTHPALSNTQPDMSAMSVQLTVNIPVSIVADIKALHGNASFNDAQYVSTISRTTIAAIQNLPYKFTLPTIERHASAITNTPSEDVASIAIPVEIPLEAVARVQAGHSAAEVLHASCMTTISAIKALPFGIERVEPMVRLMANDALVRVEIRSFTGRRYSCITTLDSAVRDLKPVAEQQEGFLSAQQRLIYAGKDMDDDATLRAHGITGDAVIHLILHRR